ncbi:MAG: biotin--[acetyl-CoA-carboxylase] ligase [Saccharofermentans sp.]|nr:biotin--[acetyl-CoA-carboxylase] ligase [Saccharofermentans sp.]
MLKDDVLKLISRERDYISGETISRKLGVSRTAINTAVKALRDDGYEITSTTNKGYLLTNSPDLLSKGAISAYLTDDKSEDLYVYDSVGSTNTVLKDLAANGSKSGTVVIADHQASGKGRRGRSFESPSGVGIYLSYLLKPQSGLNRISDLTSWTAVAVSDAIRNAYGLETSIKWVNDLLMNKKKICGILTEVTVEGESGFIDTCIIGIGINVNESSFPDELKDIATSISIENGGKIFERAKLAAEIIKSMDRLKDNWPDDSYYLERYRELNITTGSKITAFPITKDNSQGKSGTALEINEDFSLKVQFDDGSIEDLKSGEVSVRGLYGYT